MASAESLRLGTSPKRRLADRSWGIASIVLSVAAVLLFATVLMNNSTAPSIGMVLPVAVAIVFLVVVSLHARLLLQLRFSHRQTFFDLQTTEQEVDQVAKQLARNRALARSASAEADALRKTTLTLTQDLQMNCVLDTLLESLAELVPYESARVLLLEDNLRLLVARERVSRKSKVAESTYPLTLDASGFPLLKTILECQDELLLADTHHEPKWREFATAGVRSWLCVPLVAAHQTLGILCADHSQPASFSREHLRLASSLSVSAAAAIQNARLYERAAIYGAELEKRVADLRAVQKALEQAEEQRTVSDERFRKVFRSSPIAFSITTLNGGRFVDVNCAFEVRYGYSRSEAIGRTVYELGMWEETGDRALLINQLTKSGPVRNIVTRLRVKSGEVKLTLYSADLIQFDGQACILAVTADATEHRPSLSN